MKALYIFNPDTDLALANNDPNFMAPKSARQLGCDLSLIPIWYASEDAFILVASENEQTYFEELKKWFHLPVSLIRTADLETLEPCELKPWGWNRALVNNFNKIGNPNIKTFTITQVEAVRALSSREWMSKLLPKLSDKLGVCGKSIVLKTIADLESIDSSLSRFLLKAPYSGSGRGLKWCRSGLDAAAIKWFNNVVKQQGAAIVEPIYTRLQDFAMEFEISDAENISFIGFSFFKTDNNGVYQGNEFVQNASFTDYLDNTYFYKSFIDSIKKQVQELLLETYGQSYSGILGVDMMVCKSEGDKYKLHPCVEVNLRMNMGVLAQTFYNRYVCDKSSGAFSVDFHKSAGEVMAKHLDYQKKYPLVVQEGKIRRGYLSLSAITSQTLCHAWVLVE